MERSRKNDGPGLDDWQAAGRIIGNVCLLGPSLARQSIQNDLNTIPLLSGELDFRKRNRAC